MLREFLRGAAQVHALHHAAEGEIHGAWLTVELRRHGYDISPGTLYPLLHRMEAAGLLASHEETVEGRVRRVYEATDAGKRELAKLRVAVAELADEVLTGRPVSRTVDPRGRPAEPPGRTAGAEAAGAEAAAAGVRVTQHRCRVAVR